MSDKYPDTFADPAEIIMCPVEYAEGKQACHSGRQLSENPYWVAGDIWQEDRRYHWSKGWWDALEEIDAETFEKVRHKRK